MVLLHWQRTSNFTSLKKVLTILTLFKLDRTDTRTIIETQKTFIELHRPTLKAAIDTLHDIRALLDRPHDSDD